MDPLVHVFCATHLSKIIEYSEELCKFTHGEVFIRP